LDLDTVWRQEVLIIFELELLILIEGDFSREVHVPVKVGNRNVQMTLFFSIISSSKVNFVGNVLLAIVNVSILSVSEGLSVLLIFGETNQSDSGGNVLGYDVVESIERISFADELDHNFFR
jgi:hypothetical protein